MNSMPIWSTTVAETSTETSFSLFGRGSRDFVLELGEDTRKPSVVPPPRKAKPFERLLGVLSLADLNEYRAAAGREPDLDAKALYALHDVADRFFPVRNDETGGRYLRNAYLKYLSEHADLAEIARSTETPFGMPFAA